MHLEVAESAQYRAALSRLLTSRLFGEAPVQRRLLSYLGDKALSGTAQELKEYSIGVELFGKPESYSPQSDPSVRVQASRLRSKLDEFYRSEGQDSEIVVRLPKGTFSLVFETRSAAAAADTSFHQHALELAAAAPVKKNGWHWWVSAAFVLVTALAAREFAVIRDLQTQVRGKSLDPAVQALWQPLLASPRPLVVVIGTPLFVGLSGGCYRNSTINSVADAQKSPVFQELVRKMGATSDANCSSYTGVGESVGMFLLGQVLFEAGKKVSIQRSTSLAWDVIQSHDLVVLGSTKSNQQMKEIPVRTKYKLEPGGISVNHPGPNEPSLYRHTLAADGEVLTDYTLISRLPGLEANSFILMIGSESTAGNWAGVQYLTSPRYAKDLSSHLADSSGHLPNYFEVVVKSEFQSDHPVKSEYVSHQLIGAAR